MSRSPSLEASIREAERLRARELQIQLEAAEDGYPYPLKKHFNIPHSHPIYRTDPNSGLSYLYRAENPYFNIANRFRFHAGETGGIAGLVHKEIPPTVALPKPPKEKKKKTQPPLVPMRGKPTKGGKQPGRGRTRPPGTVPPPSTKPIKTEPPDDDTDETETIPPDDPWWGTQPPTYTQESKKKIKTEEPEETIAIMPLSAEELHEIYGAPDYETYKERGGARSKDQFESSRRAAKFEKELDDPYGISEAVIRAIEIALSAYIQSGIGNLATSTVYNIAEKFKVSPDTVVSIFEGLKQGIKKEPIWQ